LKQFGLFAMTSLGMQSIAPEFAVVSNPVLHLAHDFKLAL
jgi:hypothetical protein